MDRVLKDFEDAATSLPTKSTDTRNTRVTKWAALAFASQAALYEGTYRKYHGLDNYEKYLEIAASTAKQFIDESGFSLYKEGTEPYRDMFCADNAKTTEVVLARAYNFEGCNYHTPYNSASLTCKWDLPAGYESLPDGGRNTFH